jgi:hypothetical protein
VDLLSRFRARIHCLASMRVANDRCTKHDLFTLLIFFSSLEACCSVAVVMQANLPQC